MSFLSHNSSNHSHLSRRVGKKHNDLHTVTASTKEAAASEVQRPRPFPPIQFDKDAPAPQSRSSNSIFKL